MSYSIKISVFILFYLFIVLFIIVIQGCPKIVHGLMMECWETDKKKRPKFADIVTRLDELFRFPEVLNDDLLSVTNRWVVLMLP